MKKKSQELNICRRKKRELFKKNFKKIMLIISSKKKLVQEISSEISSKLVQHISLYS